MHRSTIRGLVVAVLVATTLAAPLADSHQSWAYAASEQVCDSACQRDLERAQVASAKYQDVAVALADGFVPVAPCEDRYGLHFVNPMRLAHTQLEVTEPEALLYLPNNGGFRLVGIEHIKIDEDQNLATDDDRPELYGQQFDGPMRGHDPLQVTPIHYDLHVWLWSDNPKGIFAQENPTLSCASKS